MSDNSICGVSWVVSALRELYRGIEWFDAMSDRVHTDSPPALAFRVRPAMFGLVVVMRVFRDHRILSQICGDNFMVLEIAPPFIVDDARLDRYGESIAQVVELTHISTNFRPEALQLAARVNDYHLK